MASHMLPQSLWLHPCFDPDSETLASLVSSIPCGTFILPTSFSPEFPKPHVMETPLRDRYFKSPWNTAYYQSLGLFFYSHQLLEGVSLATANEGIEPWVKQNDIGSNWLLLLFCFVFIEQYFLFSQITWFSSLGFLVTQTLSGMCSIPYCGP